MRWTSEQQRAIQYGEGLLAVVAGAGSGKTGVLTERFVNLVVNRGVDPERILAITFTRTATAEMKTRIIHKLEQHGYHDARQRIESAYIHTVHALCRRLLQENPFEAGIEPDPAVLPTPAARQLSREAFHMALDHLLSQSETLSDADALRELIGMYLNLQGVRGDPLQSLYDMLNTLVTTARHQGLSLHDFEAWLSQLPTDPLAIIVPLVLEEAGLAHAESPVATPDGAEPRDEPCPQTLPELLSLLVRLSESNPAHSDLLRSLTHQLLHIDPQKEQQALELSRALLRLACEYLRYYEDLKTQRGVLDFDDMQIRALEMLRTSATVRHRYQNLFEYLLVDETQDIDPLQAEIIELLAGGGNLMVVGDVQQSIYGFRHANPRVFRGWAERAHAHPSGQLVRLQANFRSHPDILAFVEMVFRNGWGDSFLQLQPYRQPQLPPTMPHVQVWYRTTRNYHQAEAELIAGTIRQWVQEEAVAVHDPDTSAVRPVRYGDCVLLFNQFTQVEVYERAFQRAQVPYFVVGGGRGYWLQYEVRDIANLMRALSDVEDDLALMSLLRSPMVGLSLDGVMHLAMLCETREVPLRLVVLDPALASDLEEADSARLQQFQEWFLPLLSAVGTQTVGWLLARALEATQYEAKLLSQPNGHQRVANVRKLFAIALQQPIVSPQQFADQLDLMTRTEQREGHAPTYEETANVVRFYTVHGAKGLEFPIVFLADTAFQKRSRTIPLETDPKRGLIGLEYKSHDTGHSYESFPYWYLKNQHEKRDEEEALRKLYVALTRARDYLIVALTHAQQNPWSLLLAGTLNHALNRRRSEFELPNGSRGRIRYLES